MRRTSSGGRTARSWPAALSRLEKALWKRASWGWAEVTSAGVARGDRRCSASTTGSPGPSTLVAVTRVGEADGAVENPPTSSRRGGRIPPGRGSRLCGEKTNAGEPNAAELTGGNSTSGSCLYVVDVAEVSVFCAPPSRRGFTRRVRRFVLWRGTGSRRARSLGSLRPHSRLVFSARTPPRQSPPWPRGRSTGRAWQRRRKP